MTSVRCPKQTCKVPTPLDSFRTRKSCPACEYLVDESFFLELDKFYSQINEVITLGYENVNLEGSIFIPVQCIRCWIAFLKVII